jgi:hypothetical protein
LEIIEGSLNHRITWHVSDINPASLIITRNGVLIISAAWNGDNISINVDNLAIGVYSYNCTVIDQAGNSAFDVVEVLVTTVTQTTTITTTTSTTTASSTSEGTPGYSFILFLAVIVISVILRRKVDE